MQQDKKNEKNLLRVESNKLNNPLQQDLNIEDQQQQTNLLKTLLPPNPLITKQILGSQQYINMKLLESHNERNVSNKRLYINHLKKVKQEIASQNQNENKILTLFTGYNQANLLYQKYDNRQVNQRNRNKYFSSIFSPLFIKNKNIQMPINVPNFIGMKTKIINPEKSLIINLQEQLQFSSNFESGNLFAVFKTGTYEYDLILQNDFNTNGCTQWFYFEVQNKNNKNFVAKFNIVNLYKAQSLYNKGMKPVVNSEKSGKGWLRKGFNIFYDQNSLKCEATKKYYKTLSFCYDFTRQNDKVSFSHAIPYPYTRLEKILKNFQNSNKCNVKTIGFTPLKKPIKMIKFQSQNKKIEKRAIFIMARQHPGQTQGSFLVEQMLMSFMKPSQQVQFLLWRFNIYIIPMINIDGVILGNYRCNAMGFDLNRNWQNQSKSKYPQVFFIKNQIKKIMTKQKIQLILDLHGHSRKMNSFFYGNPFSINPYLFPFVASKINGFVKFEDCRFSLQKKQKAHTARVVLGNLIKQTGNVYTYEVSFYGGINKEKKTTFLQEHYKQLGRDLIKTMYKVFNQEYKQQKSLKQSLYLKQIRQQITGIQDQLSKLQDSGSDSQAENQMQQFTNIFNEQIKQKIQQITRQYQVGSSIDSQSQNNLHKLSYQTNNIGNSQFNQNKNISQFDRLNKILSRNHQSIIEQAQNIKKRLFKRQKTKITAMIQNSQELGRSMNKQQRKHSKPLLNAQRLRIYGQTYLVKNSLGMQLNNNKDFHSLDYDFLKSNQSLQFKKDRKDLRSGNISLNIKRNNAKRLEDMKSSLDVSRRQDELMNDIVRINRLEYKKIRRQEKNQKLIRKKSSKEVGVFKLPYIFKDYKA